MQKVSLFHLFNLQTQSMLEPGDQIEKITTQKIFYQIFMNLYQHAKNQAILSFISKQWNLICRENFDLYLRSKIFDSIQDGLFGGCFTAKAPPPLKTVTHILQWLNLAQLYLTKRRSRKYMNRVPHPLNSAEISIFSPEISRFYYIKKYRYRLHFDA